MKRHSPSFALVGRANPARPFDAGVMIALQADLLASAPASDIQIRISQPLTLPPQGRKDPAPAPLRKSPLALALALVAGTAAVAVVAGPVEHDRLLKPPTVSSAPTINAFIELPAPAPVPAPVLDRSVEEVRPTRLTVKTRPGAPAKPHASRNAKATAVMARRDNGSDIRPAKAADRPPRSHVQDRRAPIIADLDEFERQRQEAIDEVRSARQR